MLIIVYKIIKIATSHYYFQYILNLNLWYLNLQRVFGESICGELSSPNLSTLFEQIVSRLLSYIECRLSFTVTYWINSTKFEMIQVCFIAYVSISHILNNFQFRYIVSCMLVFLDSVGGIDRYPVPRQPHKLSTEWQWQSRCWYFEICKLNHWLTNEKQLKV